MKLLYVLPTILLVIFLQSCAFSPDPHEIDYSLLPQGESEDEVFKKELYAFYHTWKGTPYEMGGMNREGIDCSGLVHLVFLDLRHIILPRTAEELQEIGTEIELYMLRPGDLLFFDTGLFSRHVGIHIERGRFLHVSSSRGVILSNLANSYWSDTFEVAKRVDILEE